MRWRDIVRSETALTALAHARVRRASDVVIIIDYYSYRMKHGRCGETFARTGPLEITNHTHMGAFFYAARKSRRNMLREAGHSLKSLVFNYGSKTIVANRKKNNNNKKEKSHIFVSLFSEQY